jgi:hypothetical protein
MFGAYLGMAGCVVAVTIVVNSGFSARRRIIAGLMIAFAAALAAFWIGLWAIGPF